MHMLRGACLVGIQLASTLIFHEKTTPGVGTKCAFQMKVAAAAILMRLSFAGRAEDDLWGLLQTIDLLQTRDPDTGYMHQQKPR